MTTAVDTNVLIDIFTADKTFGEQSAQALEDCIEQGRIVACETVWAETGALFPTDQQFKQATNELGLGFVPMDPESADKAGAAWRKYRKNGGKKTRMGADFLIGAHALVQCDRFLTRDRGFYRSYFSGLKVIDPSK